MRATSTGALALLVTAPLIAAAPTPISRDCSLCYEEADKTTNCVDEAAGYDFSCLCQPDNFEVFKLCHSICANTEDDPYTKCDVTVPRTEESSKKASSTASSKLFLRSSEPQIATLTREITEDDDKHDEHSTVSPRQHFEQVSGPPWGFSLPDNSDHAQPLPGSGYGSDYQHGGGSTHGGFLTFCGVDGAACATPNIPQAHNKSFDTLHGKRIANAQRSEKQSTATLNERDLPLAPSQTSEGMLGFCGVDGAACGVKDQGSISAPIDPRGIPTQTALPGMSFCGPDGASCASHAINARTHRRSPKPQIAALTPYWSDIDNDGQNDNYQWPPAHYPPGDAERRTAEPDPQIAALTPYWSDIDNDGQNDNYQWPPAHYPPAPVKRTEEASNWPVCDWNDGNIADGFSASYTPMCGFWAPSFISNAGYDHRYNPDFAKKCCKGSDQGESDSCFRYCAADVVMAAFSDCVTSVHPNVTVVCNGAMTGNHTNAAAGARMDVAQAQGQIGAIMLVLLVAVLF